MKLKDLLKGRDKLRKYDELKEWRGHFADMADIPMWHTLMNLANSNNIVALPLPEHIKQIILDALDAEIKKMERNDMLYKDADPVMIAVALERLIERGEVVLLDNPTYEEKLRIMKKVDEEIYKLNNPK